MKFLSKKKDTKNVWLVFSAEIRTPEGPERASQSSNVHYRKVSLEESVTVTEQISTKSPGIPRLLTTPTAAAAFSCRTSLLCNGTLLPEAGCCWGALSSGTAPHDLRQEPRSSGWLCRGATFLHLFLVDSQEAG